jgi:hypothetical protein
VTLIKRILSRHVIACGTSRLRSDPAERDITPTAMVRLWFDRRSAPTRQPVKQHPLGLGQQCVRPDVEIRLSKPRLVASIHRKASMKAIVIIENGGPEKVTSTEVDTPVICPGQLQVVVEGKTYNAANASVASSSQESGPDRAEGAIADGEGHRE